MTFDLIIGMVGIVTSVITVLSVFSAFRRATEAMSERNGAQTEKIERLRIDLDRIREDHDALEARTRDTETHIAAMSQKIDAIFLMVQGIKEDMESK